MNLFRNVNSNRFASASKDGTIRVWNATLRQVLFSMSQHTAPVMCVKWGGDGLLYSGSRDKTIKVWDSKDVSLIIVSHRRRRNLDIDNQCDDQGKLIRSLEGHAHWVNHLALSTDFILRTGPYDHTGKRYVSKEEAHAAALKRYNEVTKNGAQKERLASGSDDFTMFLWEPSSSKKPLARMTGHQQLVNHLSFSPDGRILASASFDKSVKLWDGATGK